MDWQTNEKKVFSFINENHYKNHILNITKNNGISDYTALGALEMYNTGIPYYAAVIHFTGFKIISRWKY